MSLLNSSPSSSQSKKVEASHVAITVSVKSITSTISLLDACVQSVGTFIVDYTEMLYSPT